MHTSIKKEGDYISLLIWLPFTKDANNQGLAPCNISGNYVPVTSGKIGNAHNTQNPMQITSSALTDKSNFTVAFWIYNSSDYINKLDWIRAVAINTKNDELGTSGTIRFECCYDSNNRAVSVHNNSANDYFTSALIIVPDKDKWHHVAFVANGDYCKAYCDGVLVGSMEEQSGTPALTGTISIGSANYVGAINDFRIYDNVLSAREIHEIAKGLVLHYPLNDYYNDPRVNLITTNPTCSKAFSINSTAWSYPLTCPKTYVDPGKTYMFSYEISVDCVEPISIYTDTNCSDETGGYTGNDAGHTINYVVPSKVVTAKGWNTLYCITTPKADNKKPYVHHGCTIRSSSATSEKPVTGNVEIRNLQLIESDCYIPYRPYWYNTVYDVSGYSNNGEVNAGTSPFWVGNDSPRYDGCYEFTGNNTIQINDPIFHDDINQCHTVCVWANLSTYDRSKRQSLISLNNGYYAVYGDDNKTLMYLNGGSNDSYVYGDPLPLNQWTHIAWVLDTAVQKCEVYYNGVLNAKSTNYTATDLPSGVNKSLLIGQNYIGKLSDLRIYATALSASDIKSIYKSVASITNTGVLLLSGEVVEG